MQRAAAKLMEDLPQVRGGHWTTHAHGRCEGDNRAEAEPKHTRPLISLSISLSLSLPQPLLGLKFFGFAWMPPFSPSRGSLTVGSGGWRLCPDCNKNMTRLVAQVDALRRPAADLHTRTHTQSQTDGGADGAGTTASPGQQQQQQQQQQPVSQSSGSARPPSLPLRRAFHIEPYAPLRAQDSDAETGNRRRRGGAGGGDEYGFGLGGLGSAGSAPAAAASASSPWPQSSPWFPGGCIAHVWQCKQHAHRLAATWTTYL